MLFYIILSPPKQLMLFAVLLSFVFYAMQILYSSVFRSTSNLQCRWQEPRPRMYRFCVCLFFQVRCYVHFCQTLKKTNHVYYWVYFYLFYFLWVGLRTRVSTSFSSADLK